MEEYYLRKIHWWIRFMVIGLIIWAMIEATLVILEHH